MTNFLFGKGIDERVIPTVGDVLEVLDAHHRSDRLRPGNLLGGDIAYPKVLRTHLINREQVRCWRFGAAARREEEEYPLWIFDRRATPLQRQRSATLRAKLWRQAGRRCSSVTERVGYASSSRLASHPPKLSALIPYL